MTTKEEVREAIQEANEKLPGEWEGSIGEWVENGTYTHMYNHPDYVLEVYHNAGDAHVVQLYEVEWENEHGNFEIGEYPVEFGEFDTEAEAKAHAVKLMVKVRNLERDD